MHTYFQIRSITSRAADLGQWRRGDAGGDAAVVDLLEKKEKFSIINGAEDGTLEEYATVTCSLPLPLT